jgi:hypothetical protein
MIISSLQFMNDLILSNFYKNCNLIIKAKQSKSKVFNLLMDRQNKSSRISRNKQMKKTTTGTPMIEQGGKNQEWTTYTKKPEELTDDESNFSRD